MSAVTSPDILLTVTAHPTQLFLFSLYHYSAFINNVQDVGKGVILVSGCITERLMMYFGDSLGFLPKVPYYDKDHPNPYGIDVVRPSSPFYIQTETSYSGSTFFNPPSFLDASLEPELPPKPQDHLILSISVAIFCNILFGLAAIYFSVLSDQSYRELDLDSAREHGRTAFKLNMTGIVVTIGVIIIAVSMHFLVFTKAVEEMTKNRNG
ncbi:uncharacterized protein LOC135484628 [Lineus longissimus]|uniref:uncharacterized protein LOC135484628 n=1 Tax=Lineus longissimus TaxID=88925 RepID=UPI00315DEBC6